MAVIKKATLGIVCHSWWENGARKNHSRIGYTRGNKHIGYRLGPSRLERRDAT